MRAFFFREGSRTTRFIVVLVISTLLTPLGACDFVIGQPTIDGRWSGTAHINENVVHIEMVLAQTNLFRGRIHTITGSARYSFPEVHLSVAGSIEGAYFPPHISLKLESDGFAPFFIDGKVSKDDDSIRGHLERPELPGCKMPITFHRE